jgi:hypothetical protein
MERDRLDAPEDRAKACACQTPPEVSGVDRDTVDG